MIKRREFCLNYFPDCVLRFLLQKQLISFILQSVSPWSHMTTRCADKIEVGGPLDNMSVGILQRWMCANRKWEELIRSVSVAAKSHSLGLPASWQWEQYAASDTQRVVTERWHLTGPNGRHGSGENPVQGGGTLVPAHWQTHCSLFLG